MDVQQIMEMLKTMQEKADADRKAFKEKMDALIANIKIDRKETTACHDEMEARINKIEPNPEEKETAMEQHEIPNEEV
jgi:hypothetical protein